MSTTTDPTASDLRQAGRQTALMLASSPGFVLVDPAIAQQLQLKMLQSTTGPARIWSIGGQPLPNVVVASAPITGTSGHAFGLLGSDVLSRFGSVTIDCAAGQLVLG